MLNEKEGVSWVMYPTKNSIPRLAEHQPQLTGISKRSLICIDSQRHRLFAYESEMRTHRRIDNLKPKDDPPTGRFLCPIDICYKNYVKRRWTRKFVN